MAGQELANRLGQDTVASVQRAQLGHLANVRPVGQSAVQLSNVRVLSNVRRARGHRPEDWPLAIWMAIRLWPLAMSALAILAIVLST